MNPLPQRTSSAAWVRGIAELFAAEGLPVQSLCAQANIDLDVIDRPNGRAPINPAISFSSHFSSSRMKSMPPQRPEARSILGEIAPAATEIGQRQRNFNPPNRGKKPFCYSALLFIT